MDAVTQQPNGSARRSGAATRRPPPDTLLTKAEAAAVLNVTDRFVERLIAERRVRFVKLGRHVRIPESALVALIESGTVEPIEADRWRRR